MILAEINDRESINKVLKNPDIYDVISSDGCPDACDMEFPINDDYQYIAGFVGGEIIGILVYHSYKDGRECHVQVLPEYRFDFAIEFGKQALKFKGDLPLYAEIPEKYKNVLAFAKANKFEIIGEHSDKYIKNGVEYPVKILKYKG